jgi:hypothetical protein
MIHAKGQGFLLSAYLNHFDCRVTLDSGEYIDLKDYTYTYNCLYKMEHMIHELWASGTANLETIKDTAGLLRIEYRLFSHPGQGSPSLIEQVVPVLARGPRGQRHSANPSKWWHRSMWAAQPTLQADGPGSGEPAA